MGTVNTTIAQYVTFLNAVAKTDAYGLWDVQMSQSPVTRGIARSGVSGATLTRRWAMGASRSPTWKRFDAARFQLAAERATHGSQTALTTRKRGYALNGRPVAWGFPGRPTRNSGSSENEYSAAYYQPAASSGPASGYWLFQRAAIRSRTAATAAPPTRIAPIIIYNDGLNRGYNGGCGERLHQLPDRQRVDAGRHLSRWPRAIMARSTKVRSNGTTSSRVPDGQSWAGILANWPGRWRLWRG